ncbi:MAG: RdgB/HAM1 family non-canonical purine NTP pyrophosphatase [Acidimicrobiales bacterium]
MIDFVLATANPDKAAEIAAVLEARGLRVMARPTSVAEVDETEQTLEGNARLKASALCAATGVAAIADDTGLFVAALDGEPGVHSARYAGQRATYADNVARLLRELAATPEGERRATFRTVICVVYPDGHELVVVGELAGFILASPRGTGGFGYDPVFEADETPGRSLAELSAAEKNALSHRARALTALADELGATRRSPDVHP